jgi:predicted DNA-binding protein (UPF0251 family)
MREIATVAIALDEFEAVRLCDGEGLDQEEAGRRMDVSRGTVQRLLYSARKRLVDAILHRKAILVNLKESEDENAGMHSHQRRGRPRRQCS